MSIIYLATPYTHESQIVRTARYEAVTHVAAKLVLRKKIIFSPITMTHPYDEIMAGDGKTLGSDYWLEFDREFLLACDQISVLMLPGWRESSGVTREIEHFKKFGQTPTWIDPNVFEVSPDKDIFAGAWEI